jgi:DNA-binding MarR family transcriptional regulator
MVRGLVEAKLVVRVRTNEDRRLIEVAPTALGKTLLEAVDRAELRWLESIIEGLGGEDRAVVERAVEVLLTALEEPT